MMLADNNNLDRGSFGQFGQEVHQPFESKITLVEFIARELSRWCALPDRPQYEAETRLTKNLCTYLNGIVRRSNSWSHIQFSTEIPDEINSKGSIDLGVELSDATLIIEGRRYEWHEMLFPIECKRLPTPEGKEDNLKKNNRDAWEYVITRNYNGGGIQRFKFGLHGASHEFAAMIAYVQQHDFPHWFAEVNRWIQALSNQPNSEWTQSDLLQSHSNVSDAKVWTLESNHERVSDLPSIELRHLWINMQ
jgi:hypothetical protein